MSLYTLCTTDTIPAVETPAGLRIEECTNTDLLTYIGSTTPEEVTKRLANDNIAYVAYIKNIPAAFGWVARGKATIGELAHEMVLPIGNRYLWNFRTLEAFRGLGIYPALLQYITRQEKVAANRFWIIHAPENKASLKGIKKAGFHYVGRLYSNKGYATIESTDLSHSSRNLLAEMNISISKKEPASCWNCSSPYLKKRKQECCCATSQTECVGNNLLSMAI
jgi:GNAT superfamily N-acetyltransferase